MKKMLEELMKSKQKSPMSGEYKEAKGSVLKELMKAMDGLMLDDVKGLKKVTVAAKDDEGLKAGLEKAEDMVEESLGESEDMESEDESESEEEPEAKCEGCEEGCELCENEDMDLMKLEEKIKKLEELKNQKLRGK